jgi:hypothetical protein
MTGTWDEKARLGQIIGDARKLAARPVPEPAYVNSWAERVGELEATLKMLCDSAEIVASEKP